MQPVERFFLHLEDFSTVRSGGGGEKSDAAARDKSGGGPKYDHGLPGPQDAGRDLRNRTHGEWKKRKTKLLRLKHEIKVKIAARKLKLIDRFRAMFRKVWGKKKSKAEGVPRCCGLVGDTVPGPQWQDGAMISTPPHHWCVQVMQSKNKYCNCKTVIMQFHVLGQNRRGTWKTIKHKNLACVH